MIKFFIFIFLLLFINNSFAEDSLLTLKQKLDRLQRDVNDLSKSVFSANKNTNYDQSSNLTAIDIRIYDLEKDIKNLNMNFEELIFQIDNLSELYNELSKTLESKLHNHISNIDIDQEVQDQQDTTSDEITEIKDENLEIKDENILGTLVINSENLSDKKNLNDNKVLDQKLSPEEEYQLAFDLLRSQKFDEAKLALKKFINNNSSNKLSGSAHYWLGEIYLLNKEYRQAALVFAEGYQKYPNSVKSPDILYKLAESLLKIKKKQDACSTFKKFTTEHSKHKLFQKSQAKIIELGCDNFTE